MSYRVAPLPPQVNRIIASWHLPDALLVEVHLRLNDELPALAPECLIRAQEPFDGMTYFFEVVDPENSLVNHAFMFHIFYHPDEETLAIADARYVRQGP
jgi:hypothetical protein